MSELAFLGHACFKLTADNGYSCVIDPYQPGSVPGIALPVPLVADEVFCSHEHHDHNAKEVVTLETVHECPYKIESIVVPHDDDDGRKRGMNEIRIFTGEGHKIVHLGDTGRMLTLEELDKLNGTDVLMVPVGGYFTIDALVAKEIVSVLNPRLVILMHYRADENSGYDVLANFKEVQKVFPEVVSKETNTIDLNVSGVYTLKY